ncbi:MAG: hypothetical protein SGILL_007459, partial [Bacillariaceae sp.]
EPEEELEAQVEIVIQQEGSTTMTATTTTTAWTPIDDEESEATKSEKRGDAEDMEPAEKVIDQVPRETLESTADVFHAAEVVVETTVLERSKGTADSVSAAKEALPEKDTNVTSVEEEIPTVNVEPPNDENEELKDQDNTNENEATEGDAMEEYEPSLLEAGTEKEAVAAVKEDISDSSVVNDEQEVVEPALSLEEERKEEIGDKMDTYEPSLLDSPVTESLPDQIELTSEGVVEDTKGSDENALEIAASEEDASIDPDQDVVSFIGKVLDEDVKPWVTDADSFSEILGNKTRGGHVDEIDGILIKDECQEPEASIGNSAPTASANEEKTPKDSPETVAAEIKDSDAMTKEDETNSRSQQEVLDELKPCVAVDRDSLEKEGDKDSDIAVSVVTWNLAEESPSDDDAAFIRKFRKNGIKSGSGSDLVLISGQECENIKPRRSEGRRSREFRRLAVTMLGKGYVPIAMHLLGGIQFVLFSKRSFLKEIEEVVVADVTCGIGNVFHNKGAIAAFLTLRARNDDNQDTKVKRSKLIRMMFVTAHMAAHVKNADARDADFWRISSELEEAAPESFLPRKKTDSYNGSFLFDSVDRVFFCGDLNYRVDLPRELTEYSVLYGNERENNPFSLLRHDQLIHSMAEGRAFSDFAEGKIKFAPTFKFDKETDAYDTSHKQRIPAWTDRIVFRPSSGVRVLEYLSVPQAQHSDHRPVYGIFRVNMEGKELPAPKPKPKKRQRKQSSAPRRRRSEERY